MYVCDVYYVSLYVHVCVCMYVCMYVPVLGILASFIGRVDNILHDLFLFQQGVSVKLLGSQIMCMYVGMYVCMYVYIYVCMAPLLAASAEGLG